MVKVWARVDTGCNYRQLLKKLIAWCCCGCAFVTPLPKVVTVAFFGSVRQSPVQSLRMQFSGPKLKYI